MGSDAYSPITTSRQLDTPQGYRIYTTSRKVAAEFPIPAKGTAMTESNFIGGFTGHYILDVVDSPTSDGHKKVTVTHGTLPTGSFTEYESFAYTFPPIYPNGTAFFPGGCKSRPRHVPARVTYEYGLNPAASPTDWYNDPTIWDFADLVTGPFEVKSFLAEAAGTNFTEADGSSGLVGDFLNPMFIGQDSINDSFNIYAPGSLYYEVDASIPSATDYAAYVAAKSEFIASMTIHTWYCFYMRRTVWVRFQ